MGGGREGKSSVRFRGKGFGGWELVDLEGSIARLWGGGKLVGLGGLLVDLYNLQLGGGGGFSNFPMPDETSLVTRMCSHVCNALVRDTIMILKTTSSVYNITIA